MSRWVMSGGVRRTGDDRVAVRVGLAERDRVAGLSNVDHVVQIPRLLRGGALPLQTVRYLPFPVSCEGVRCRYRPPRKAGTGERARRTARQGATFSVPRIIWSSRIVAAA